MAWVGGKKALREEVLARFPLYYERYIEVFGGGGWVLFHKPPGTDFEVYNDLNGNLAALYRAVRDHPRELQERLRYVLNSREDFMRLKQVLEHPEGMAEVARAAAFYQVIRYSYAAGCGSFAAQPHSMWGNFPLIDKACARLQKVVVENTQYFKRIGDRRMRMNRIKKVSRPVTCLLALLLCVMLLASTAFAAGGALGADRNGTPYTYVIGYMYSGSSQTVNTREIFTSPNNYDIWLCPVCGRDPLGNSQGTALSPNLYMPCYGYDIAAAGGDMSIRYALVRHRHNNGQLSDDRVYIPVNVPMYAGCYYGYDLTEPAGVQVSAPTGWQRDSAVVQFYGGTDTGTSLPDWSAAPGDYGSGIHHYEYQINGGAWTGCPVGDPTVTTTAGGITTVTARVVDGAGNASGQTATAKVYIDPAPPNVPDITLSTEQWTNSMVTAAIKDNGDAHSGVARTEYSLDGGSWTTYSGVLSIAGHGKHTVSARAIDNVGRISGTASKTALVDKVAPVISKVEQQPDRGHTEMTLAVTATDADSGVKGYAVTTEEKAPALDKFQDSAPKADHNGVYYIWAADKAGNISAAAKVNVTALDIVPPVVVKVETQRTWDATCICTQNQLQ